MKRLIFLVPIVCGLMACGKDSATSQSSASTAYSYVASDSTGQSIAIGTFTIDVPDSTAMSGTWSLSASNGATATVYGPQFGTGAWRGTRNGFTLAVDMNAGMADNNVVLSGVAVFAAAGDKVPQSVHGSWNWITMHGLANLGSFSLTRK